MEAMKKSVSIVGALLILLGLGLVGSAAAQDLDDYNGPMSNLRFVVVKDANGKPVRNAAVVLHPGPIIRGLELTAGVADGPQSAILEQVTNGVAIRMAVVERALTSVHRGGRA